MRSRKSAYRVDLGAPCPTALALAAAFALIVLPVGDAGADEPDQPAASTSETSHSENTSVQRPWLYVEDPSVPAPLQATVHTGASLTSTGTSVTRPFASNVAPRGGAYELGAELGLLPRLSAFGTAVTSGALSGGGSVGVGVVTGLRVQLYDTSFTHLTLSGGYLLDLGANNGAFARLAFAQDAGRVRLAVTGHGEHIFAQGRDALDLMVMAGVSYRVANPVRVGVEYVAQDIEAAFDPEEAEGGVRHFIGPNVAFELANRRLLLSAGPAVGLSYATPTLLARASLTYAF